jgi:hypothetical protein
MLPNFVIDAAAVARLAGAGLSVGVVLAAGVDRAAAALDLLVVLAIGLIVGLLLFLEGAAARAAGFRALFDLVAGLAFLVAAAFFDDLATETPTPFVALTATTSPIKTVRVYSKLRAPHL